MDNNAQAGSTTITDSMIESMSSMTIIKYSGIVFLLLFQIVYQANSCYAEDKLSTTSERAQKHNAALNKFLDYGSPSIYKIAYLLAHHDYASLEKWFDSMLNKYRQDPQYEGYLDQAYAKFKQEYMPMKDLNAWVDATGSSVAYAARGVYQAQQGWDTYDAAAVDLQNAIRKNPSLMPAYTWLITMAIDRDMPYTAQQILQAAEKNDKQSYSVRYAYMRWLEARMGKDSVDELTKFAEGLIPFADLNPRLWSLQGEADFFRGQRIQSRNNFGAAVELYTSALKYGDQPKLFDSRSFCYLYLGQKALEYADRDKYRYYASRDNSDYMPGSKADVAGLKIEVSEKNIVSPRIGMHKKQSYLVFPIEAENIYATEPDEEQRIVRRYIDRMELVLLKSGNECVERNLIREILKERKILATNISYDNAQSIGRQMSADVIVIGTHSHGGVGATQVWYAEVNIKAVSVSTGKILWKALLKSSAVVSDSINTYYHERIYEALDNSIYAVLEEMFKK